ncbi:hypothetical protein BZM27_53565, partial [Paraburkholderia steynii]
AGTRQARYAGLSEQITEPVPNERIGVSHDAMNLSFRFAIDIVPELSSENAVVIRLAVGGGPLFISVALKERVRRRRVALSNS